MTKVHKNEVFFENKSTNKGYFSNWKEYIPWKVILPILQKRIFGYTVDTRFSVILAVNFPLNSKFFSGFQNYFYLVKITQLYHLHTKIKISTESRMTSKDWHLRFKYSVLEQILQQIHVGVMVSSSAWQSHGPGFKSEAGKWFFFFCVPFLFLWPLQPQQPRVWPLKTCYQKGQLTSAI